MTDSFWWGSSSDTLGSMSMAISANNLTAESQEDFPDLFGGPEGVNPDPFLMGDPASIKELEEVYLKNHSALDDSFRPWPCAVVGRYGFTKISSTELWEQRVWAAMFCPNKGLFKSLFVLIDCKTENIGLYVNGEHVASATCHDPFFKADMLAVPLKRMPRIQLEEFVYDRLNIALAGVYDKFNAQAVAQNVNCRVWV